MARLLRLPEIIGDKDKGIPALIPVSKSSWWNGVKKGIYPKSIKIGPKTTCWKESEILSIVENGIN